MRAFLLDTNIWTYWFDPKTDSKLHANIQERLKSLPSFARLSISVISWGEIDYGYNVNRKKEQSREVEFRKFISGVAPWLVPINRHTAKTYGELRARLFDKYAEKNKRTKKRRPEQLIDPVTSLELKIQENDLWIAAQAISRNLMLVTNDAMEHIREVAGNSLHIDNWAVNGK
jgi:predicted nucleic acid-binding protein